MSKTQTYIKANVHIKNFLIAKYLKLTRHIRKVFTERIYTYNLNLHQEYLLYLKCTFQIMLQQNNNYFCYILKARLNRPSCNYNLDRSKHYK